MPKTIAFLLSALLAAFATTDARAEWYGSDYQQCTGEPTVEIIDCVKERAARWDRELNRAYRELMALLPPERQESLRAAQRRWINYRDANCAFYAAGEGSIGGIEAAECLRAMTQLRYIELNREARPEQ